jgi:hypothetical protein
VEQTVQGSFIVSAAKMRVLRQGLFVTLHHGDELVKHDLYDPLYEGYLGWGP